MIGIASLATVARSASAAASSAAPALGELAAAGCMIALAGVVVQRATKGASFARRALFLHALTALLLVFTVAKVAGLDRIAGASAVAAAPAAASWLAAPRIVAPRAITSAMEATSHGARVAPIVAAIVVIAWLAGALCLTVRMLIGARLLAAIRKRGRASTTGTQHALASGVTTAQRRSPLILASDEVDVPFASGLWSPAIVVPDSSEQWTANEWRVVLLHEASHVARGDIAMQWVRQLVLALHWFNPGVHWLVWRADEACEGACDDAVVARGNDPARYARTLVSFAGHGWRHAGAPAPTIAGRSGLERRIVAMLDGRRTRRASLGLDRSAPRLAGVAGGLLLALLWPRFAIRVEAATPASPPPSLAPYGTPAGVTIGMIGLPARPEASPPSRGEQGSSDTTEALLGLGVALHDVNPIVRDAALRALGRWRSEQSLARLRIVARRSNDNRRAAALDAIAAMENTR